MKIRHEYPKDYNFGQRLKHLMRSKGIDPDEKASSVRLAERLLDECIVVTPSEHLGMTEKSPQEKQKLNLAKSIRRHMEYKTAERVETPYLYAYCDFFKCSADYLLGYCSQTTPEIKSVNDITGLHPDTIEHLIKNKRRKKSLGYDDTDKHFLDFIILDDQLEYCINNYCQLDDELINLECYVRSANEQGESVTKLGEVKDQDQLFINRYQVNKKLLQEASLRIIQDVLDRFKAKLRREYKGKKTLGRYW